MFHSLRPNWHACEAVEIAKDTSWNFPNLVIGYI